MPAITKDGAQPQRFTKKPVTIEAAQWLGLRFQSVPDWLSAAINGTPGSPGSVMRVGDNIYIETLEGRMCAEPGDWIIRGIKGELYPCKPDIFDMSYEAEHITEAAATQAARTPAAPVVAEGLDTHELRRLAGMDADIPGLLAYFAAHPVAPAVVAEGLSEILQEASEILAAIPQGQEPKNMRFPIVDELMGFAGMVAAHPVAGSPAEARCWSDEVPCNKCNAIGWHVCRPSAAEPMPASEAAGMAMRHLASIADLYDEREDDSFELWQDANEKPTRITLGQCRAIRAHLAAPAAPTDAKVDAAHQVVFIDSNGVYETHCYTEPVSPKQVEAIASGELKPEDIEGWLLGIGPTSAALRWVGGETPAAQSVRDALEQAANICDSVNNHDNPMTAGDCADAIRALIQSPQPGEA